MMGRGLITGLLACLAALSASAPALASGQATDVEFIRSIGPDLSDRNDFEEPSSVAFRGALYYAARNGAGWELWRSDGTRRGTAMLKDIEPGSKGSLPATFAVADGKLYFTAKTDLHGREVWRSDGTARGTKRVKDVNRGTGSSHADDFTQFDGDVYFTANDGEGWELWTSDGTAAGTRKVVDLGSEEVGGNPRQLTAVRNQLFFTADDGVHGRELWRSDGTAGGTALTEDINSGPASSFPIELIALDGFLLFSPFEPGPEEERELWRSDGTPAGTYGVKDIQPGSGGDSSPSELTKVGKAVYFRPAVFNGGALWRSDGTAKGTVEVRDLSADPDSTEYPSHLTASGGSLYFTSGGYRIPRDRLWRSNGARRSTAPVKSAPSPAPHLADVSGSLYFSTSDGGALWRTDRMTGTRRVGRVGAGNRVSITEIIDVGGDPYLVVVVDGRRELWRGL